MTSDAELKRMGLATLKIEGELQDWETGNPLTPAQAAAYETRKRVRYQALQEFEEAMQNIPDVLTPSWFAFHYQLADQADERGAITFLRRLLLWRLASGNVEHPKECAAIVMPEGEKRYSAGW